jgi:hypothetical protein
MTHSEIDLNQDTCLLNVDDINWTCASGANLNLIINFYWQIKTLFNLVRLTSLSFRSTQIGSLLGVS